MYMRRENPNWPCIISAFNVAREDCAYLMIPTHDLSLSWVDCELEGVGTRAFLQIRVFILFPAAGAEGEEGLNNVPLLVYKLKVDWEDALKKLTQEKMQNRKPDLERASVIQACLLLSFPHCNLWNKMLRISVADSQTRRSSSYLNGN